MQDEGSGIPLQRLQTQSRRERWEEDVYRFKTSSRSFQVSFLPCQGHISESAANVVGPLDLDLGTTDDNREEELAKNSSAPRPSLSTLCASCPGPPACACRVPSPQGSRGTHVPTSQLSL